ncbi:MAG: glycosyltransferase family 4 protein [Planctomycetaceae bacterium]
MLENVAGEPGVTHFRGCDTPGIREVLRRRQLDALAVNGWVVKSCLQGLSACRKLGIPCLVRGEANLLRRRAWWKSVAHRRLLRRYAAALYIGAANKAFYEQHGIPQSRLFPAPYCVENDRFRRCAEHWAGRSDELRRRWGIPADVVCFVFAAKFIDKKHPLELLQSFAQAVAAGSRVHLLMVGDGALRPACEAFAANQRLPVTFTGFLNQTQIAEAYQAGDCLVLPSDAGETWGLVVNEAMACGRPAIVSSLVGCAADLIVPGATGAVFTYGDWGALAGLLVDYGRDRGRVLLQGRQAQERMSAYSPEAAARGILEAARAVTGRKEAGASTEAATVAR